MKCECRDLQRTNHFELGGLEPFSCRQASYVIRESHLTRSDDGFDIRYAIDESGVCEGRPIDQSFDSALVWKGDFTSRIGQCFPEGSDASIYEISNGEKFCYYY